MNVRLDQELINHSLRATDIQMRSPAWTGRLMIDIEIRLHVAERLDKQLFGQTYYNYLVTLNI